MTAQSYSIAEKERFTNGSYIMPVAASPQSPDLDWDAWQPCAFITIAVLFRSHLPLTAFPAGFQQAKSLWKLTGKARLQVMV